MKCAMCGDKMTEGTVVGGYTFCPTCADVLGVLLRRISIPLPNSSNSVFTAVEVWLQKIVDKKGRIG